jgi:hypothetical protein
MEDPTDVASIPSENASNNSPTIRTIRMSGTMVRKVATRTFPWSTAAEVNLVLPPPPPPPPLPPPPPQQDEDLPVAKRPRLGTSTADRMSTAAGAVAVADPDKDHSDEQSIAEASKPDGKVAIVVPTHASLPNDELDATVVAAPVQNENKGFWTPEEDAMLTEAVRRHGKSWGPIAALVPGRTNRQCRSRWLRQLDPANNNKGEWTREEDLMLIRAVGMLGKDFIKVAALVPGRTNERCRDRWVRNLDFSIGQELEKGAWTPEEDAKLIDAVQRFGQNWVPVANLVYTRTNSQCRQRWLDNLVHSQRWLDKYLGI